MAAGPASTPTAAPVDPAREAALRQARDKARREKAEADARARQQAQREQELARLRADQEADARRRADERQQARPVAPLPQPAAPTTASQTIQEICGGRNLISRGICEIRECAKPAHTGEAICKEIKAREERRNALQN
jgi:hypothetical protein